MKRAVAIPGLIAVLLALALPAGAQDASKGHAEFGLAGEARGLEIGIGTQGATLGLSLARADSLPSSIGVGAGQCTLLGEDTDPETLPCTEESTVVSRFPGEAGSDQPACAASLPAPLDALVQLKLACGTSQSGSRGGLPFTKNQGKVGSLDVTLPVGTVLNSVPIQPLTDQLTDTLSPVLDAAPKEVKDAVDNVLELVTGVAETEAIALEVGPSMSNITSKGKTISVDSASAGALIGVLGIPQASADGTAISVEADPLTNGLLIIEVGTARASASLNTATAAAAGAASPALVTVKVRDITKPEPTYVEVSVAPGETVTVLEGTPAESTITAADSTVEEKGNSAAAGADAVRLHLLKGVQGGVTLGLGRATAAAQGEVVKPAPPIQKAPDTLPLTGATDMTVPALGLIVLAGVALWVRRRVGA